MSRADIAFARANDRLFATFGEEAILRLGEPAVVVVSEGIEIVGEYGQVEQRVTTATFRAAAQPRAGNVLHILTGPQAGHYTLDKPLQRAGAQGVSEWILRATPPAP